MSRSPLVVPEHPELPPDVRQVYVEVDRKFGVFIFPQLQQLTAEAAVARLLSRGSELAQTAAEGRHAGLADAYRALLAEAQRELRDARTVEVERSSANRQERQHTARLDAALAAAKTHLPASRLARLESRLAETDGQADVDQRVAVIEGAVLEWDRLSQTRQAREADRLADQAHLPVRPRHTETSRSRKARRDQARIVELARAFAMDEQAAVPAGAAGERLHTAPSAAQ
ncbi:MAG: hypothetical protein ACYDC5_09780 [Candidatus Dormibacteria bacterium]